MLELSSQGTVTSATIDGVTVAFPLGRRYIVASKLGAFSSTGVVSGPGGSGNCFGNYQVVQGGPPPSTPNFAVVPAYCGANTLPESGVTRACIGVVKRDTTIPELRLTQVILLAYSDGTAEVLPVIARKVRPKVNGDIQTIEDVTFYANGSITAQSFQVLDTRTGVITKLQTASGEVPTSLEGRSAKGKYFNARLTQIGW